MPKGITKSINGASGGELSFGDGGKLKFEAASFMNVNTNELYEGAVTIFTTLLDPASASFTATAPGDRRGVTKDGKHTSLHSFGILGVELRGAAGEILQLVAGKAATVTLLIPEAFRASAPASIKLWRLNESTGMWEERGEASKDGNYFVGKTDHFSYWEFAEPMDNPIPFHGFVKNKLAEPVGAAVAYIGYDFQSFGRYISTNTNSDGSISGWIPAGKTLQIRIYKSSSILYESNIGPFQNAADLGTITVEDKTEWITLKGTVVDCNGQPVATGNFGFYGGTYTTAPIVNGKFEFKVAKMNFQLPLQTMIDVISGGAYIGDTTIITADMTDFGTIRFCNDHVEYIRLSMYGQHSEWYAPTQEILMSGANNIWTVHSKTNGAFDIRMQFNTPGGITEENMQAGGTVTFYKNGIPWATTTLQNASIRFLDPQDNLENTLLVTIAGKVAEPGSGVMVPYGITFKVTKKPIGGSVIN